MAAQGRALLERRRKPWASSRWTTPRALRVFLVAIWVGAALLFVVGESTLSRARQAMKTIGHDAAPSIMAAQEIRAHLADLDANAANYLLGGAEYADSSTQLFEYRRAAVTRRLLDAAQNITYGDAEKVPLVVIAENLGRYLEAVGDARALMDRGDRVASLEAYRVATEILHGRMLPAAEALDQANSTQMDSIYKGLAQADAGAEFLAVLVGGGLCAALALAQMFLFRRLRRVLNVPLAAATVLSLVFLVYLVGRFGVARQDLKIAKEDAFESIHTLWKIRAQAYDANGDETRYLLDRERERVYDAAFQAKVRVLTSGPDQSDKLERQVANLPAGQKVSVQGLFADELNNLTFRGERQAAVAMVKAFGRYWDLDRQIRALASAHTDPKHRDAVRLNLGDSNEAFAHFDEATLRTLLINKDVFDQVLDEGDRGLRSAEMMDPLFAGAIALLGWLGLRKRLREYR